MRLKQIKLAGFKSFVDPTKIPFQQSLTAIIGPNGCGKSNVIDAVRWVLGESSAKHLRGDSMTDVIFNGSSARRPISVAGVELIFENKEGRLAGQYASYEEIAVKRQVSRDGESWYYLNGQKCRRKDITDLFMGTGLGPRSYAIIEQGTISRLIESKPQDLRVFIEEAAGISRYKERRRDTENRIRHTRENLERLGDIRGELAKQIDHLATQAQAALKYREYKQAERKTHAELLVMRYQELTKQADSLTHTLTNHDVTLAKVQAEYQAEQLTHTQDQLVVDELTEREQSTVEAYYQAGTEIVKLEQQVAHQQQRDSQISQQLVTIETQIDDFTKQITTSSQLLEQLNTEVALHQPQFDEWVECLAVLQQELGQHDHLLKQEQDAVTHQQQLVNQQSLERQLALSKLESNAAQIAQYSNQLADIDNQLAEMASESSSDAILAIETELTVLEQGISAQTNAQTNAQHLLESTEAQLKRLTEDEQQIAKVVIADSARLALIEQWLGQDELGSGIALWQQLRVANGWEDAAEILLDGVLNQAVGVDVDAIGFSAFVPQRTTLMTDAQHLEAYVSAPVNLAPWLRGLHWVKSIEEARALLPSLSDEERIVTADGFLLGQGFVLQKGSSQSLVTLNKERLVLQSQIGVNQDNQAEIKAQIVPLLAQKEQQKQALAQALQQSQSLALAKTRALSQRQSLQALAQQTTKQHNQLLASQGRLKSELSELTLVAEALSEREFTLEASLDNASEALTLAQSRLQQAQQTYRDIQAQLATLEQKKQHAQHVLQASTTQVALVKQKLEQQHSRVIELHQTKQSLAAQLAVQQSQDEDQDGQGVASKLATLLSRQQETQQRLSEIRTQQAQVQERLDSSILKQKQYLGSIEHLTQIIGELKLRREGLKGQANSQLQVLQEENIQLQTVLSSLPSHANPLDWQQELDRLRNRISRLGAINLAAIEEFEQQSERKAYLDSQDQDLTQALESLEEAIRKIDKETRTRFKATFDQVNQDLGLLFPKVFGGGSAYLALTDDDLLETGVTIMARPPGKKNSTIHLLSGGEKALTALSLVFAIFRLNPAPFCMLDEVDAPLDDANVERFCRLLKEMSQSVQFIYISHNKITMEMADQLIGVTMHEPGVSRIVAVDIDEAMALADVG